MKNRTPLIKSLFVTFLLSLVAALPVYALWAAGVLASVQATFVIARVRSLGELAAPQSWVTALLILSACVISGLVVERAGARRALLYIGGVLLALLILSLAASAFFQLDIVFAPAALAAITGALVVQVRRLRATDMELTRNILNAASEVHQLEGAEASERLMSGLKLLEAVLPLDEAIIFHPDENGGLAPAARTRSQQPGVRIEADRNS
ncbi:MAG TPA: hypothetical protein VGO69_06390, partial [Pyrinomonadaceae bacterium]|nr:hypothetical protein [Pyrinomonadaceae bacterium]